MAFIRVRDKQTRHEFDLPEGHHLIRKGLVDVVKKKVPSARPRPPRHFKRLQELGSHIEPSPSGGGSSISTENEVAQ